MLVEKNIISNLINNTISWNNSISNLWGQSEKNIAINWMTLVPQNYGSYKITPTGCM